MKIVVFGTGGVGGYFGGRLAQAGRDVTFIARGAHLAAIKEHGLKVESKSGDFVVSPAQATNSTESVGRADLVILATKAWQLESSIDQVKPLIGGGSKILPLLNGIEHIDLLQNHFGKEAVMGGLCRISAVIGGPGHIKHMGVLPIIEFGSLSNHNEESVANIRTAFTGLIGVEAKVPADMMAAMWSKYILMSALSGVGAAGRCSLGELRSNPLTRARIIGAMSETAAVGRARGVKIPPGEEEAAMRIVDMTEPHMTASMQKDMEAGRPSELEAQVGAIIRMGKAAGVPTPTHDLVYAELLPREHAARAAAAAAAAALTNSAAADGR